MTDSDEIVAQVRSGDLTIRKAAERLDLSYYEMCELLAKK
jgi:hypothetical protein